MYSNTNILDQFQAPAFQIFNPDNFFVQPEESFSNKKRCFETTSSISSNVNDSNYGEPEFKRQKCLPSIDVNIFQ